MPLPAKSPPRNAFVPAPGRKTVKPGPVWEGPCGTGWNGGVTQSLLGRFLTCPVRFKAAFLDGWRTPDSYNGRMEFGNLWHACEEGAGEWQGYLQAEAVRQAAKYPLNRGDIDQSFGLCRMLYEEWLDYRRRLNEPPATAVEREAVFDVSYTLPDGHIVRLRGKRDGIDRIGKETWLNEHKTKSSLDRVGVERQLVWDMQTMFYIVALQAEGKRVAGVKYNVVKRSTHKVTDKDGGVGGFVERIRGMVRKEPDQWLGRWTVNITRADVDRFRRETLDPVLTRLHYWYLQQTGRAANVMAPAWCLHYRHPVGNVNWIDEAGHSDMDQYVTTGSTLGLVRQTELFPELK